MPHGERLFMVKAKTGSQNVLFTSINTDKEWHDSVMRKLGISHGRHSLSLDHMPCFITTPSITDSLKVLAKKQKLSSLAVVGSNHSYACFICGERPVFITDGEKMWPEKDCEYPDGILLKFELNVPSGEMVVASDLREHFNTDEHYELDNRMARVKTCLAIAKSGCAFLIVGNRITGIYRVGKDKFVASKPGEDSRTGKLVEAKGKRVATVITDSDSYSIVDGDEY